MKTQLHTDVGSAPPPSPGTDRTLTILEALSESAEGLSVAELVRATGFTQNSVFRITQTLWMRGYLVRDDEDKRYRLSGRLFTLSQPRPLEKCLAVESQEAMRSLCDASGETAQVLVASAWKMVVLAQKPGRHAVKVMGEIGMRVPMFSCAPGKAMLAWLPDEELNRFFEEVKLKRYTPTTLCSRKTLLADLIESRERGFALDRSEGLEGIHCAAAPILDEHEHPVGAITIVGPAFRLTEDRFESLGRACMEAARSIERRLRA